MANSTSDVWKFFIKLPGEEKAKCNACADKLAYKKGSTKGLWDHFKVAHTSEYEKYSRPDASSVKLFCILK
jgi:hypothetical protein